MDVPDGRRPPPYVFCIRVQGKSMIDAFIDDGDHVLLETDEHCRFGETIVVGFSKTGRSPSNG